MFAYCGNNPVNRKDPTGHFWSELWEFAKTAFSEIGKTISNLAPAYTGCGSVAALDGPLPFGDAFAIAGAAALTLGAVGYGIYQASKANAEKSEAKGKAVAIPQKNNNGTTYYHVTTPTNAAAIKASGVMTGSSWEGGYVFAWRMRPSQYAIKNSGADLGVIISFKTRASFSRDKGIEDPKVALYLPVVSNFPGPIAVWDVEIVGVIE